MAITETATTEPKLCPCQSEKAFKDCCEPYIEGKAAPTPESLMRSRYSAFTLNNMDYIEKTMEGPALKRHLKDKAERENEPDLPPLEWVGLNILETTLDDSKSLANTGTVRFNAFYRFNNRTSQITENSVFKLIDGRWYYYDVKDLKQAAQKIGRNDPCSCGSGKKFKKCCGQN